MEDQPSPAQVRTKQGSRALQRRSGVGGLMKGVFLLHLHMVVKNSDSYE